jgi:sugar lactone lactonase YvrE
MTRPIFSVLFVMMVAVSVVMGQNQIIDTFAGGGPNNIPATNANIAHPTAVATDNAGNVYISSAEMHRVFKVTAATGILTVIAGDGQNIIRGDGGPATSASLMDPKGVAPDSNGNVFIADFGCHCIRKVDSGGIITTVAGNGNAGFSGDGGPAAAANLFWPFGLVVDVAGNLFISEVGNNRIRKVDAGGTITTVAGDGNFGFNGDGGPATSATFSIPWGIALDSGGNLFIADEGNHRIRKVDTAGVISTVAGNGNSEFSGDGGPATSAGVLAPFGVTVDPAGNIFITDSVNGRIRTVDSSGIISTTAGNGSTGFGGDGGPATDASLSNPFGVATDNSGNLFIADQNNNRIRKVDSAGVISTLAGNGTSTFGGDGNHATGASLNSPGGLAIDGAGNVYLSDNHRIRRVDALTNIISTVAGT